MPYRQFLGQRYRVISGYTGLISLIIGVIMLLPLLALWAYPAEWPLAGGFLLPGILLVGGGGALWRATKGEAPRLPPERSSERSAERSSERASVDLSLTDATVVVVFSWLLAIGFGTVPFMAIAGLTFTQAAFESTSGWTTTGLSVLTVGQAPHLILLFRSLTQLFGGAGFAIIALSAISGPLATELSAAEGHSQQLVPHLQRSAKRVLTLYTAYVVVGIIALRGAGMGWFEAINHAFTTLSTGGFSTHADSIGHWHSTAVEVVTMVLMLLGGFNYVTAHLALNGRFKAVWRNSELRLQGYLIGVASVLLMATIAIAPSYEQGGGQAIRTAAFAAVTALSTTGFATVNYTNWQGTGLLITIVLMMIGGHSVSTAGGLKLYRVYSLYRAVVWKIRRQFLAAHVVTEPSLWQGERQHFISERQLLNISLYVLLYLCVLVLGTGVLSAYGYSLEASLFEYTSALSTVGLSVGVTSPTAPPGLLWAEIIGMLLGRLEIVTVLIGTLQIIKDGTAALSKGHKK